MVVIECQLFACRIRQFDDGIQGQVEPASIDLCYDLVTCTALKTECVPVTGLSEFPFPFTMIGRVTRWAVSLSRWAPVQGIPEVVYCEGHSFEVRPSLLTESRDRSQPFVCVVPRQAGLWEIPALSSTVLGAGSAA